MSDDAMLGSACCIPRRYFALLVSGGLFLYGVLTVFYYGILVYFSRASLTPSHCSGSRCVGIATCGGLQDTTFHVNRIVLVLGGAFFGLEGFMGAINGHGHRVYMYSRFLAFFVGLLLATMVGEVFYSMVCDRYSYNVIYESVLWSWPHLPFNEGVKREIEVMDSFPYTFINALTKTSLMLWFLTLSLGKVIFWYYAMQNMAALGAIMEVGTAGLGANFSVKSWRDETIFKNEVEGAVMENAIGALHSVEEDVGMINAPQESYGAIDHVPRSFAARVAHAERQRYRAEAYGLQV